jgi:hypothetical protein
MKYLSYYQHLLAFINAIIFMGLREMHLLFVTSFRLYCCTLCWLVVDESSLLENKNFILRLING